MASRIEAEEPDSWEDLENKATRILVEAGFAAERGKSVESVRGTVTVDVYSEDDSVNPPVVTLFECKYWTRPVPQTVVHAFRTVVIDTGANAGLIVSKSGFQSGANNAASFSNVKLIGWDEFQDLHADRWYRNYMMPTGWAALSPLISYVEHFNSRIFRKADALSDIAQQQFKALRDKHHRALDLAPLFFGFPIGLGGPQLPPDLPMRDSFSGYFPGDLLGANSLRGLLDAVIRYAESTTQLFDDVFGERA
ncbi:restriction endonuclease [Streptomyces sp. NPDC057580]|uniref:restriction endonuclease n=1 Tax=Streptomyces sp. NPDC057580 TaxID=3346173 RepID=UPI0036918672